MKSLDSSFTALKIINVWSSSCAQFPFEFSGLSKQCSLIPDVIEKGLFTSGNEVLYLEVERAKLGGQWLVTWSGGSGNTEIIASDLRCRAVFWTRGCGDTFCSWHFLTSPLMNGAEIAVA